MNMKKSYKKRSGESDWFSCQAIISVLKSRLIYRFKAETVFNYKLINVKVLKLLCFLEYNKQHVIYYK